MKLDKEQDYGAVLEQAGFHPCPTPEGFPREGSCWEAEPAQGQGYYWIYSSPRSYCVKIHDFWFREDTVIDLAIPECLSVTWYESISGEELLPYRQLNSYVVKSFLGGYEPFRALIHRRVPIRSIGIEYYPAYYERRLREQFGALYQSPQEAFRSIDETSSWPEMSALLKQVWRYQETGLPAQLYYDAKAAEALSLVFERHRRLNQQIRPPLADIDREMLQALAAYIGAHYADQLTIEGLSQIACMGTTKLKKCFKAHFGVTVGEYIQNVRIGQAEHLLAYTDLPVGEVAQAVGYTAAGHFAQLFRKSRGVLPMEYRRLAKG